MRASPLAQSWENVGFSNTSIENKFVLPTFRPGTLAFFRAKDETDASICYYIALNLIKCCHWNCTHMHSHTCTPTPTHACHWLTTPFQLVSSSSWGWSQNNKLFHIRWQVWGDIPHMFISPKGVTSVGCAILRNFVCVLLSTWDSKTHTKFLNIQKYLGACQWGQPSRNTCRHNLIICYVKSHTQWKGTKSCMIVQRCTTLKQEE